MVPEQEADGSAGFIVATVRKLVVSAISLAGRAREFQPFHFDPNSRDYQWKDQGIIIRSADKSPFNAIDPQLLADTDGRLWMVFGSFWTGIQHVELKPQNRASQRR